MTLLKTSNEMNKIRTLLLSLFTAFFLNACVNIKAPDNLLSDTVDLSKELYNSVKNQLSNDTVLVTVDNKTTFESSYLLQVHETLDDAFDECKKQAIDEVRKTLNIYEVLVKKDSYSVTKEGDKTNVICTVEI